MATVGTRPAAAGAAMTRKDNHGSVAPIAPVASFSEIPIGSITTGHHPCPRPDISGVESLVASIRAVGLLHPLSVELLAIARSQSGGRPVYRLLAGERRLTALRALRRERVPALVYQALSEAQRHRIAHDENAEREAVP